MTIDLNKLPSAVIDAINQTGQSDEQKMSMTPQDIFHAYCNFQGLYGWGRKLALAYEYILAAERASPAPAVVAEGWKSLNDAQWMNIVNHDHAYNSFSKEDAVHEAVKRTEAKLKELNATSSTQAPCMHWRDAIRKSGGDTDYHGRVAFTQAEFKRFVDLISAPSPDLQAEPFAYFVQPSSFGPYVECKPSQEGAFPAFRKTDLQAGQDARDVAKLNWDIVSQAAQSANNAFGQFMPLRWVQEFVKAYDAAMNSKEAS